MGEPTYCCYIRSSAWSVMFLVAGIMTLGLAYAKVRLPHEWVPLSSTGVALTACTVAAIYVSWLCFFVNAQNIGSATWNSTDTNFLQAKLDEDNDRIFGHLSLRRNGGLSLVSEKLRPGILQILSFCYLFLRIFINVKFIIHNFAQRPERNPDQALNMAKLMIIWAEMGVIVCHLLRCLVSVLCYLAAAYVLKQESLAHVHPGFRTLRGMWLHGLSDSMQRLGSFSTLQFVQTMDMAETLAKTQREFQERLFSFGDNYRTYVLTAWQVLFNAVYVGLGLLGMLVKLDQVKIVLDTPPSAWSYAHVILFLGFCNNMTSLVDERNMRVDTVLRFCFGGADALMQPWEAIRMVHFQSRVITTIADKLGFLSSLCLLCTLDSKHYQAILIDEQDGTSDVLLNDLSERAPDAIRIEGRDGVNNAINGIYTRGPTLHRKRAVYHKAHDPSSVNEALEQDALVESTLQEQLSIIFNVGHWCIIVNAPKEEWTNPTCVLAKVASWTSTHPGCAEGQWYVWSGTAWELDPEVKVTSLDCLPWYMREYFENSDF